MSLESALEEERLEILKLLERSNTKSPPPQVRPYNASSPLGSRTTSPSRARVTSLIDIASPPSTGLAAQKSPNSSPTLTFSTPATNGLHRNSVGAAPRLLRDRDKPSAYHDDYQFSMISSVPPVQSVSKRVAQGSKPVKSMLGGIGGDDRFSKFGKRSGSPTTNAAMRHAQVRSISPRPGWQTDSARSSAGRLSSPPPDSRYSITSENGTLVDLQHAYRRLNDEALASSGGILGSLPEKKVVVNSAGEHIRAGSGESLTREGGVRLQKDYEPGDERAIADSTDDESTEGESTDDEDGSRRGRKQRRTNGASDSEDDPGKKLGSTLPKGGRKVSSLLSIGTGSNKKKGEKKKPMSLLAAADEERKTVSSKFRVQSLVPSISVTQPGIPSSPITARRSGVHPTTNFDYPSHNSTPMTSETELDLQDIRRAQRMEMVISPITSTPETHRVVRTIVRGDFDALQDEAEQGKRRQRTYLVATDMSGEAAHALEWTIGTVLRDGDTLLAIYAADEDSVDTSAITPISATVAINGLGGTEGADGLIPPSSPAVVSSPIPASIPNYAQSAPSSPMVSFSTPPSRNSSPPPSMGAASRRGSGEKRRGISRDRGNSNTEKSKAELERVVAADTITQLVTKLLKKTRLQVRCVVEVIHCKSPKHLLTEMIDYIEPTLVILGSRGRSALKGVLLGSFSNYLVTKSSVPVMVARKKLKQHSTKKKKANSPFATGTGGNVNVRLSNNLVPGPLTRAGSNLANAKID